MVLYPDPETEERFRKHVLSIGYTHGDLSKVTSKALNYYLDNNEDK